jgi:hypothetical protein
MRILPRNKRQVARLLLVIAVSFAFVSPAWWAAQARYSFAFLLKNRVRDRAGVLMREHVRSFFGTGNCAGSKSPATPRQISWYCSDEIRTYVCRVTEYFHRTSGLGSFVEAWAGDFNTYHNG